LTVHELRVQAAQYIDTAAVFLVIDGVSRLHPIEYKIPVESGKHDDD
jgi:hypothetical protein